jgi:hypothetical protein
VARNSGEVVNPKENSANKGKRSQYSEQHTYSLHCGITVHLELQLLGQLRSVYCHRLDLIVDRERYGTAVRYKYLVVVWEGQTEASDGLHGAL